MDQSNEYLTPYDCLEHKHKIRQPLLDISVSISVHVLESPIRDNFTMNFGLFIPPPLLVVLISIWIIVFPCFLLSLDWATRITLLGQHLDLESYHRTVYLSFQFLLSRQSLEGEFDRSEVNINPVRNDRSLPGFLYQVKLTMALTSTFVSLVLIPICYSFFIHIKTIRKDNEAHKAAILKGLGLDPSKPRRFVGFFHPYCNAGGGGERVLWTEVKALQRDRADDIVSVVYSGDLHVTKEEIIAKVRSRFDISLDPSTLHFVFLERRWAVEDATWPYVTLLGQSLGSVYLAYEALVKFIPDLYIDTMGYAFTFHVFSLLGGVPVGAYVHYPTISTNMLKRVQARTESVTNASAIRKSSFLSGLKLFYYRVFMFLYAYSLRTAAFLMVNSSWTKNHVDSILAHQDTLLSILFAPLILLSYLFRRNPPPRNAKIAYPSCDTREMSTFKLEGREKVILSVAQFRPEKDHAAQLRAFAALLKAYPEHADTRLVLLGGSRNEADAQRVEGLRKLADELSISDKTNFVLNAPYADMLSWLSRASVGLSTMVDEHFGINVVELMASGVIPVTHASGGPLNDIVVPVDGKPTGYHATDTESFARSLNTVLSLSPEEQLDMRKRGRKWATSTFSEQEFEKAWNASGWERWLTA